VGFNRKKSDPRGKKSARWLRNEALAAATRCAIEPLERRLLLTATLADPGFESPALSGGQYQYNPTGTPWTFSSNSGIASNGSGFGATTAPEGNQVAFLQDAGSSISQQISGFTPGTYYISVAEEARNGGGNPFEILLDNQVVVASLVPASDSSFDRVNASFTVGTAGTHTLTFEGLGNSGNDVTTFIDDIYLGVTPYVGVSWTGGGDGTSWSDPQNWSSGAVPESSDDVVIDAPGTTININSNVTVSNIVSSANLNINGNLAVTDGNSSISGSLTLGYGSSLLATGQGTELQATGATTMNGASLYASGGATLSLPGVTSYAYSTYYIGQPRWQASGAGSEILLANLTSISNVTQSWLYIQAQSGGEISLPALASITNGYVSISSDGTGSVVNLPALTSFSITNGDYGYLSATDGGQIIDPLLTTTVEVNLTITGAGSQMNTSQLSSVTYGSITVDQAVNFNGLTDIDGCYLVSNGATLSLPGVTSYAYSTYYIGQPRWQASGAGSEILLANLTSISNVTQSWLYIQAQSGGEISLPALASITSSYVSISSDGTGSVVNLPVLASFNDGGYGQGVLSATNGGQIIDPMLTTTVWVYLNLTGSGSQMNTSQLTSLIYGGITVDQAVNFNGLTDIDGSSLYVSDGATLSLPNVSSYGFNGGGSRYWQASGAGSEILLSGLTGITNVEQNWLYIQGQSGGEVSLPALASITSSYVSISSDGTGSVVNLPVLASFIDTGNNGYLSATDGGEIIGPSSMIVVGVNVTFDNSSTLSTQNLTLNAGSSLNGVGTFDGNIINNSGLITPAGTLTVEGYYTQANGGTLKVNIGGTTPGSGYGQLVVTGQATLAGTLQLGLTNGFFPTLGETFNSVVAASISGQFSPVTGGSLGQNIQLNATYGSTVLTLTAGLPVVSWTGAGDGKSWTDPNNWSNNALPTSADAVVIDAPGTTINVNTNVSVASIQSTANLDITNSLTVTSGESSVSGSLTVGGAASLSAAGQGTVFQATGPTTINGSSLYASGGATLSLPNVSSYSNDNWWQYWQATGTNSVISLPNLTSISNVDRFVIEAQNGGEVSLPVLASLSGTNVGASSDGTGSIINLPILTSFSGGLSATDGGEIIDPLLTTAVGVNLTITGIGSQMNTSQLTSLTDGSITVDQAVNFNGLTDIDGSSLYVSNGATLSLPNVSSYSNDNWWQYWQSTGTNSVISLPNLTIISNADRFVIEAQNGGEISLPLLASLNGTNIGASSDGTGSVVNLPVLTSVSGSISATDGGEIIDPLLTTTVGVNLTITGVGSQMNTSQLTSVTYGSITVDKAVNFNGLTDIDGSSLYVSNGAILSLPQITHDQGDGTLQASGTGSELNLPNLTTLAPISGLGGGLNLEAYSSGKINLLTMTAITGAVSLLANGTGSSIIVPVLANFVGIGSGDYYIPTLQASGGGIISDSTALTISGVYITFDLDSALELTNLTLGGGAFFSSTGTFDGNLINSSGTVNPAGSLTIQGNYTQAVGGALQIDIGGTTAGSGYDQLIVTGVVSIDGTLQLGLINGFFPTLGESFTPLTAASVTGGFTSVTGSGLGQETELDPTYSSTAVTLTANKTFGPYITSTSFSSSLYQPFSSIDVTFNKGINASTFTTSQVLLAGPNGAISITSVNQISANVFQINFATQNTPGQYQLAVGPDITDFAGDEMDQGQSGMTNGFYASATLHLADLVPQSVTPTSSTAVFGGSIQLSWTDQNEGNEPTSGSEVDDIYLSNSTSLNSSSVLIGTEALPAQPLSIGGQTTLNDTATLPSPATSLPAGTYYIIIKSTESGNTASSSAIQVTEPSLPDLGASSVTAPVTAVPGQPVTVNWTLSNTGESAADGPWTEQILFSSDAAGDDPTLLSALTYSGNLANGASVARSATVELPADVTGNVWFVVIENPDGEVAESNTANNTAVASNPTAVPSALTLALSSDSVSNNAGADALTATLTRNGSTASALTVTISNSDTTDVLAPTQVIIPAGQASTTFAIGTIDEGIVRGTQSSTLTASASGLLSSSAQLTVTDINTPALSVSVNANSVNENATNHAATATITTNDPSDTPLVVTLLSNTTGKLTVPATVTIPAGQTSVTVPLTVIQDYQIDGNANVTITATAAGFADGTAIINVVDTNLPTLSLSLADTSISQSAGANATMGTVTFSQTTVAPMIIFLTSDNTSAATVPSQILVDSGESSVSFPIAAVNDGLDQGDQSVTITAEIITIQGAYLASTKTSTSLTVVNSNGPALTITLPQAAISAGGSELGTVTRNTSTTDPLVVTLASSDTTHATVPQTVTIPAGQASATFEINGIDDGLADGEQYSQISASAPGLATALVDIGVTTVDLPDLTVSNVTAPTSGDAGSTVQVSWTVLNNGMYAASGPWADEVFLDPVGGTLSTTPIDTVYYTSSDLDAGASYTQSDQVTLPTQTGAYTVRVVTDADQSVQELSYNNNTGTSTQTLNDIAPYHATVSTSIISPVSNGTAIPLSGTATYTATGQPAADVPVGIFISVNGTTRELQATTDSNGNYSTIFQPLQYEAGQYSVGADYPGATSAATQTTFQIVGMTATPSSIGTLRVVPNTPITGTFTLNNLSNTPLTGLSATVIDAASDLTVNLTPPSNLSSSGQGTLSYSITSSGANGAESSAFYIQVTSNEGAIIDIPVAVNVVPVTPQLVANPGYLNVGMLVGGQTLVSFQVTNTGGAPTGNIQVSLPSASYLSLASPATLSSLAPGASATITLLLSPAADLALEQYTGNVALNFNGGGVSVPFTFQAISGEVGSVQVLVDDDYTFYAAGAPHVAGATVTLLNPYDNSQIIASGTTDSTGQVTLTNVPAGTYTMQVQAAGHASYQSSYSVKPGITNTDEVFLTNQTVTYTWQVVPTEIQDQYSIQLQTTFETDVPAPVVTLSGPAQLPTLQPGQSAQINLTLTNRGLLAADDVTLNLPSDPEYTFRALTNDIETLPALSSVTVPVIVTYQPIETSTNVSNAALAKASATPPSSLLCTLKVSGTYSFVCGIFKITLSFESSITVPGRLCDPIAIQSDFNPPPPPTSPSTIGLSGETLQYTATPVNCYVLLAAAGAVAGAIYALSSPEYRALAQKPPFDIKINVSNNPNVVHEVSSDADVGQFDNAVSDNPSVNLSTESPLNIVETLFGYSGANTGQASENSSAVESTFEALSILEATINGAVEADNLLGGSSANTALAPTDDAETAEIASLTGQLGRDITSAQTILALYSYFLPDLGGLDASQTATSAEWITDFFTDAGHTTDGSIDSADQTQLLASTLPQSVSQADAEEFISRWNRTVTYYDQGIYNTSQVPSSQSTDFLDYSTLSTLVGNEQQAVTTSQANGYTDPIAELDSDLLQLANDAENGSVCASIELQIDQSATLTRDAFAGTLDITNNQSAALTSMQLVLNITDANGNPVNGQFYISSPTFTGSLTAVDGTGVLPADASGTVNYTFIPDDSAAANGPTVYYIGGTLSYVDPVGGAVSVNIYPSTITIYPQAKLQLNYFLQQDVIGEDPSQPNVNIPSEPATLGMLVTNVGGGTANNLSITTAQPQIVENEKGLLDTFQIIGTQVGTQQESPSLTVDLGDVAPGQTADADFLLTSSLQGILTNFSATFTHSDALGGLDTSLISSVVTHDLVHAGDFNYADSTGEMDYLADDTPNFNNLPDTIYFSDGTTVPVNIAGNVQSASTSTPGVYQVTASVTSGWDYLQLPDPGAGYTLYKVVRSDGTVIPVSDQAWTTDRTFSPDGKSTIDYELHILDDNSTGSYTVYYKPITAIAPAIASIQNISSPQSGALPTVTVTFNEAIDPTTFTNGNLNLTLNGGPNLINSAVTIAKLSPTTYSIGGLSTLTASNGNYVLTVSAAGVNDGFGDVGSGSQSVTWATGTSVPVVVSVGAGNPSLRNTAVSSVDVVLSETIVASSFTDQDLSLTLNGGNNLINGGVTVNPVNSTSFEIDGLQSLTASAGTYVLTVNATGMVDAQGNQGVGSASETWVVDTTTPTIVSLGPTPQSPRNIVVPTLDVTFSKAINPSSFTYSDLSFSKAGGANLITSSVVITQLSSTEFEISNFENLVAPIDGTYTFTVNAAGVSDLAGNAGIGSASQSWVLDTTAPAAPTNLNITPQVGVSGGNDVTTNSMVTLTGSIGESGLLVQVFEGSTDLGYATVSGQTFSEPLSLASGENDFTVEAVDQAGNLSPDASINVFLDNTPPTASFSAVTQSSPQEAVPSVQLTFGKAINPTTFTDEALSLTLNGGPNLITSGVTITNVGGNTYEIDGLQSLGSEPGEYQLTLNTGAITDLDGNTGAGNPSVTWQVLPEILPAAFSNLALPSTITYGDSTAIVSGTISSGTVVPGDDEFVAITLNGVTVDAPINAQGDFAASLDTTTLPASSTPYQILYSYAGDSTLSSATDSSTTTLTVNQAPTTTMLSAPPVSIIANGTTSVTNWVTATVAGVIGAAAPSGLPTFAYYYGPSATGMPLTSSPTTAGTYTVVASYGGDNNYLPSSAFEIFTIEPASVAPTSSVAALPSGYSPVFFTVSWSGQEGSGDSPIASYTIYVSDNGGAFTPWLTNTTLTSATFTGNQAHTYGFYSVAIDSAGNVQVTPTAAQATARTTIYGDANLDGVVDIGDLNILISNYFSGTTWATGDFTGNGVTDITDLDYVLSNYFQTVSSVAQSQAQVSGSAVQTGPSTITTPSPVSNVDASSPVLSTPVSPSVEPVAMPVIATVPAAPLVSVTPTDAVPTPTVSNPTAASVPPTPVVTSAIVPSPVANTAAAPKTVNASTPFSMKVFASPVIVSVPSATITPQSAKAPPATKKPSVKVPASSAPAIHQRPHSVSKELPVKAHSLGSKVKTPFSTTVRPIADQLEISSDSNSLLFDAWDFTDVLDGAQPDGDQLEK